MQDPVGSFLRYIATTKRYSPHTVAGYRRDIGRLLAYLGVEFLLQISFARRGG